LLFDETTKKREVLELIGERSQERRPTSYRTLTRDLIISPDSACSHLKRLWRDRLIRSADFPPTYLEAMQQGQSIRELDFVISRRGVERLEEWKRRDEDKEWCP
jgi:hypothetical protein